MFSGYEILNTKKKKNNVKLLIINYVEKLLNFSNMSIFFFK